MKRSRSSHPPADTAFSPGLRRLAWLNIAVQAAFPLAVAFTPVMAGAGEQHFLQQRVPLSAQRTQVYTLGAGETAASVAKKFHLTLDQLREINQLRTFAHGLNGLQPGDDVDVPLMTAKDKKTASGASTASSSTDGASAAAPEGDEQAQKVAGYASQAGSFLAGSAKSDAAASMARGMATGEAGGALQQWLSHFGTARVQLDVDKNFSLKNSQFDLLMPLYDQGDNLAFTQGSLHRTDSRTQANLGAGLRHFTPTYMLGGNLFGDYDLSRDHARMGAGLEYWRDFLKLGANGYMRLTGWKDSPDLADYQERPANGWDIRAQAWVPSLPQLGGKLTYEQYYGQEVALFGVDNRQKNPHAITAGINYTPVPLITLGAEQRQGQSGKSDTRLTVDMNYQLGVPWRNQVDPTAVAALRSLTGSRYDLVERNNNIVLEYRKKETLRLHTADLITGHAGEQKSLGVSVTSTYGLSRIDWDAAALSAAGGKIVQNGSDYAVVLPAYQTTATAANTYIVSGVAVDTKGNRSDRSDTQVTVLAPVVSKQASTFTPVSSELPADGKSAQELTLTLRDENNQAVDMDVKDISLNSSALKSATVSALTKKSAGVYTVTVTAGTDVENVTLTPTVSGIALSAAGVTISSNVPDAGQSVFTASPESIAADNTAISTLTLVAKDAQGNALTGLKDSLAFTIKDSSGKAPAAGTLTESAIAESSTAGTYTATLKGTAAGKYTIVPEYNGTAMGSLSATVTLTDTTPDENTSAIKTDSTTYVDGTDMSITVTLKDKNGTALTGDAGLLTTTTVTVPNATLKTGSSWTDNGDGTYTATYTATTVSTDNQATLKLSGWSASSTSEKYAITAVLPDAGQSDLTATPENILADNIASSLLTFIAKDAQGNAITGLKKDLKFIVKDESGNTPATGNISLGAIMDGSTEGTYTATLRGTVAGKYTIVPEYNGTAMGSLSATVTLTDTTPDENTSAIKTDSTTYVDGTDMSITVTLKDKNGTALTGDAGLLTTTTVTVPNATLKTGSSWTDNGDGTYTATYTATTVSTDNQATLKLSGWSASSTSEKYAITAVLPDAGQSDLTATPENILADNIASSLLTFIAKDAQGNAITGLKKDLKFIVKDESGNTPATGNISLGAIMDGSTEGTYTATLRGTVAGKYTIVPEYNGSAIGQLSTTVTLRKIFSIDFDSPDYSFNPDESFTIKAVVKDSNGNTLEGVQIKWVLTNTSEFRLLSSDISTSDGQGVVTVTAVGDTPSSTTQLIATGGDVSGSIDISINPT